MAEDMVQHIIARAVELEQVKPVHAYISALHSFFSAVDEIPGAEDYHQSLTTDEVVLIVREIRRQATSQPEMHANS